MGGKKYSKNSKTITTRRANVSSDYVGYEPPTTSPAPTPRPWIAFTRPPTYRPIIPPRPWVPVARSTICRVTSTNTTPAPKPRTPVARAPSNRPLCIATIPTSTARPKTGIVRRSNDRPTTIIPLPRLEISKVSPLIDLPTTIISTPIPRPEINIASPLINTSMPTNLVPAVPAPRPWIPLARPSNSKQTCIFTVMCYNILCDSYATKKMYNFCPSWALDWDYRKRGILDEIRLYSADIINLQEVAMEQFYNYFLPELKKMGYDGIYSPKSRAKYVSERKRKYVDGCAIFYKTAKFTLVKTHLIEFSQLAMDNANGIEHMFNRVMPRDNIGLAALLQTTKDAWDNSSSDAPFVQQPILVCTSHLHWDPEFCDVKLIQTMMLSNEIKNILEESARTLIDHDIVTDPKNIQLVLCGDFNSLPGSGVIEFLVTGKVSQNHKDFKEFSYKEYLDKILSSNKRNEITHSLKLASAYDGQIMPFTNYTFDFKGVIDYIFHAEETMVPLNLLGPPPLHWLQNNGVFTCPHPNVFSDHFPLLVELEMSPTITRAMNVAHSRR